MKKPTDTTVRTEKLAVLWARFRVNLFMLRVFFTQPYTNWGWQEEIRSIQIDGRWVITYVGLYRKRRYAKPEGGHVTKVEHVAYYERTIEQMARQMAEQ